MDGRSALPPAGFVFGCNRHTERESLKRKLFALPGGSLPQVLSITPGTPLFLYNIDSKELYGGFVASSHGGKNLEPEAFQSYGSFPAQVRVEIPSVMHAPLVENEFHHAMSFVSHKPLKFKYQLEAGQVEELRALFKQKPFLGRSRDPARAAPAPRETGDLRDKIKRKREEHPAGGPAEGGGAASSSLKVTVDTARAGSVHHRLARGVTLNAPAQPPPASASAQVADLRISLQHQRTERERRDQAARHTQRQLQGGERRDGGGGEAREPREALAPRHWGGSDEHLVPAEWGEAEQARQGRAGPSAARWSGRGERREERDGPGNFHGGAASAAPRRREEDARPPQGQHGWDPAFDHEEEQRAGGPWWRDGSARPDHSALGSSADGWEWGARRAPDAGAEWERQPRAERQSHVGREAWAPGYGRGEAAGAALQGDLPPYPAWQQFDPRWATPATEQPAPWRSAEPAHAWTGPDVGARMGASGWVERDRGGREPAERGGTAKDWERGREKERDGMKGTGRRREMETDGVRGARGHEREQGRDELRAPPAGMHRDRDASRAQSKAWETGRSHGHDGRARAEPPVRAATAAADGSRLNTAEQSQDREKPRDADRERERQAERERGRDRGRERRGEQGSGGHPARGRSRSRSRSPRRGSPERGRAGRSGWGSGRKAWEQDAADEEEDDEETFDLSLFRGAWAETHHQPGPSDSAAAATPPALPKAATDTGAGALGGLTMAALTGSVPALQPAPASSPALGGFAGVGDVDPAPGGFAGGGDMRLGAGSSVALQMVVPDFLAPGGLSAAAAGTLGGQEAGPQRAAEASARAARKDKDKKPKEKLGVDYAALHGFTGKSGRRFGDKARTKDQDEDKDKGCSKPKLGDKELSPAVHATGGGETKRKVLETCPSCNSAIRGPHAAACTFPWQKLVGGAPS